MKKEDEEAKATRLGTANIMLSSSRNVGEKRCYQELRRHLGEVFRRLAIQKESKVEEGHLMPDHVPHDARRSRRNMRCRRW